MGFSLRCLLWRVGFSLVVACRFFSSLAVEWAPEHVGSVVCGMWALVEARELSSCGTWA